MADRTSLLSKSIWYVQRLRKFTFAELKFRVEEQWKIIAERVERAVRNEPAPTGQKLAALLGERTPGQVLSAVPAWFPWADRDVAGEAYRQVLPHRAGVADEELQRYRTGTIHLFGRWQNIGRTDAWLRDWESGYEWPTVHWSRVGYRWPPEGTDVRRLWELNRLHHLVAAAGTVVGTGNDTAAERIVTDVASWIESNPPLTGPNWASSLELGIRLVSFGWLRVLVGDHIAEREGLAERFLSSVWLHVRQLRRYPSRHSSNNNHAIGEALGLYAAGVFFPEFREAAEWRGEGRSVLDAEACRQILPEGGSFEQTSTYLRFTLEFYIVYLSLARLRNETIPESVQERVKQGLEMLAWLHPREGELPLIGDNDDGAVLRFGDTASHSTRHLLAAGALLLQQPELQPAGQSELDERSFWLYGTGAGEAWRRMQAEETTVRTGSRNGGGIGVIRKQEGAGPRLVTLRAGPFGAPPNFGHAHADLLSVTMATAAGWFLIDPGNYLYFGAPEWRTHFRSCGAHNLVQVDRAEQGVQTGPFLWENPPSSQLACDGERQMTGDVEWTWQGDSGRQERHVMVEESAVVVNDEVFCQGHHRAIMRWHIHPDWQLMREERGSIVAIHASRAVRVTPPDDVSFRMVEGSAGAKAGWWAPSFDRLESCKVLIAEQAFVDQLCWRTTFATGPVSDLARESVQNSVEQDGRS